MSWAKYGYFKPVTGTLTSQLTTSPGELGAIVLPGAGTNYFTFYDSASGSTSSPICRVGNSNTNTAVSTVLPTEVEFRQGLYVVADQAGDAITAFWN